VVCYDAKNKVSAEQNDAKHDGSANTFGSYVLSGPIENSYYNQQRHAGNGMLCYILSRLHTNCIVWFHLEPFKSNAADYCQQHTCYYCPPASCKAGVAHGI
jgi:hypothetical protein